MQNGMSVFRWTLAHKVHTAVKCPYARAFSDDLVDVACCLGAWLGGDR